MKVTAPPVIVVSVLRGPASQYSPHCAIQSPDSAEVTVKFAIGLVLFAWAWAVPVPPPKKVVVLELDARLSEPDELLEAILAEAEAGTYWYVVLW